MKEGQSKAPAAASTGVDAAIRRTGHPVDRRLRRCCLWQRRQRRRLGRWRISEKASESPISSFAIVAPEKGNDYGYNQQGVDAAKKIASDRGSTSRWPTARATRTSLPSADLATTGGAEFIIAQASGYNTIAPDVASQTGVPMIVWDNPEANTPGVTANVSTESQEGAYLAGVLAANTSKSGNLGIVISADDTNWNKMAGGSSPAHGRWTRR